MATEITVRGSFSTSAPPERGMVRATISYEGPEMAPVYDRVARDVATVKDSIDRLQRTEPSPIIRWSAERLRTWSDRPWNSDGERLPLVHHAAVGVEVEFADFSVLSQWVGEHTSGTEGFDTNHVSWALTDERREALIAEARADAVRDAAARAQQYADALDLGPVRPVAIADAGMLGLQGPAAGREMFLDAAPTGGAPDVELVPADIHVAVTVEARFLAGG
ncbi:SIMPL domain-containing protein [Mycobacterium sp. NPDC003323]